METARSLKKAEETEHAGMAELLAKEEIRDAMARYARGADRGDADLIRSAYHRDARDDHGWGWPDTGYGIAALVDLPPGQEMPFKSIHFLGQHLIEVDGDRAWSEIYFQNYMRHVVDGVAWDSLWCGRYVDEWERRGGPFKIARRRLIWDSTRTDANLTPFPGPDHGVPKAYYGGDPLDATRTTWGTPTMHDPSYDRTPKEVDR